MYDNRIGDRMLGLNAQARAVLEYLSAREPDFAEYKDGYYGFGAETHAWYNGRERGFSLTVSPPGCNRPVRIFVVVEGRNHDGIVVYEWEQKGFPYNGPSLEDFSDEAFHAGKVFPYGAAGDAADYIYNRMRVWWVELGLSKDEGTGEEPSEDSGG